MVTKLAETDVSPIIEDIANKEYLGRMPIVGRTADGSKDVVAYFPTGRSAGSKARYLDPKQDGSIKIDPSIDAKAGQGNPALIYYNALRLLDNGWIVVTNGAQTDLVVETYERLKGSGMNPTGLLREAFKEPRMMDYFDEKKQQMTRIDITSFEPDAPNYTPRTSTLLGKNKAAMVIAFRNDKGEVQREFFDIPLVEGRARALPTYTGQNVPSGEVIPHFEGEPFSIPVVGETPEEFCRAIFNSLGPKGEGEGVVSPREDFRVGVVAVFRDRATNTLDYKVMNVNKPKLEGE